ncbi:ferrichrome-iron receptor [Salinisphaera sp. T5B8]|uniref:TonB-dependent receptor n=1 Tax=Salinisphaera sp. T5B8 TaxID=1304154 RepID=UPI00333E7D05
MRIRIAAAWPRVGFLVALSFSAAPSLAQPDNAAGETLAPLTIEDSALVPAIAGETEVSNRLNLSAEESPATVDTLTSDTMQRRGLATFTEAARTLPGVTGGNIPGSPASLSMRGLPRGNVNYLFDGMRAADSELVVRDFDTFNFERIEILKGPASVLHGDGGLAGTVNLVTKKPTLEANSAEAMASVGSFDTLRAGIGGNRVLSDRVAVRADLSHRRSEGFIDDNDSRTTQLTTGVLFQATDRLSLSASYDYFRDHYAASYYGAPLVGRAVARDPADIVSAPGDLVLDKAERDTNYNPRNSVMESDSHWLRTRAAYTLNDRWEFINELAYYTADRNWVETDSYTFNPATGLLDRSTGRIAHDQDFVSERAYTHFDGELAGHRNRFAVGGEYKHSNFTTPRRFGSATSVTVADPDRGHVPGDSAANFATRVNYDSQVDTVGVFAENALNLTDEFIFVAGVRYEHIDLDRRIDDLAADTRTTFGRSFDPVSWRVGAVYELSDRDQLYAQFNHAVAPVGSLLLSNTARAEFDLSEGDAIEIGLRNRFWGDRATLTTSLYQIKQNDILTQDPNNPQQTVQGGSLQSRGVELDLGLVLTERWQLDANLAVLDAEYARLFDGSGRNLSGNTPVNVPEHVANLSSYYTLAQLPFTVGADVQHAGDFHTDTANTIRVDGHTVFGAWVSMPLDTFGADGTLTLRGRNLTDEFYGEWSGYSASQIYIGAPRSVELAWTGAF